MMTSSQPREEIGGKLGARRGHVSHLSISDPNHHVTEAIGKLYGDEDDPDFEDKRPLNLVDDFALEQDRPMPHPPQLAKASSKSQFENCAQITSSFRGGPRFSKEVQSLEQSRSIAAISLTSSPSNNTAAEHGFNSLASPTLPLKDIQAEPNGSSFPLTNINNPSDIAQELSNLQALRRLSMDVGNHSDPDMPPIDLSALATVSPSRDDEDDPSRLLWVPARIHPELAPTEFKSFLEKRLQSIRRRSRESALSSEADSIQSVSTSALKRQKSILSRQSESFNPHRPDCSVDVATLPRHPSNEILQTALGLEELARDPTRAVCKLTQEARGMLSATEQCSYDLPILPMAPGLGLRRSTRTTYRKGGSLRSEDRGSGSRRYVARMRGLNDLSNESGRIAEAPKVQSYPNSDNHSRPARSISQKDQPVQNDSRLHVVSMSLESAPKLSSQKNEVPVQTSSVETVRATTDPIPLAEAGSIAKGYFPRRTSSQQAIGETHGRPMDFLEGPYSQISRSIQKPLQIPPDHVKKPSTTENETSNTSLGSPSSLSGSDASRTDNLTFIPTLAQVDTRFEKKGRRDREDGTMNSATRSGGAWKWFKGVTDERDKKREESRRLKTKAVADQRSDHIKAEASQTIVDRNAPSGRKSQVFDRDNFPSKIVEERKKESTRRSDVKREKDGNLFSSIFGGGKKKEEKEKVSKRNVYLQVPEFSHHKPMQPDVDYHWTRFPLLEERAIYRMAHIKLANPRRPLLSQVLLSNFMYSYLAIVQAMHPQMNVPISPQQKRLEDEARRKEQEQRSAEQHQMPDDLRSEDTFNQYDFNFHRAAVQYADTKADGQVYLIKSTPIYGHDIPSNDCSRNASAGKDFGQEHHQQPNQGEKARRPDRTNVW